MKRILLFIIIISFSSFCLAKQNSLLISQAGSGTSTNIPNQSLVDPTFPVLDITISPTLRKQLQSKPSDGLKSIIQISKAELIIK